MSNAAQERLTLLALGIRGDQPVDSEQPPLPDGVHLRWFPAEQKDGLPWYGFYLFRRESQPARSVCLSTQLGDIRPGQSKELRLLTKLGILSSAQPLLFTDDFAPAGTVEVDLRAPLRFDLPDGVKAGRVTVRVGFRAGEVTRTCVDFRPFPLGSGPNPRTEQGAVFTIEPLLTPPSAIASINEAGSTHGLQGVSRFESSVRIAIKLPCPATRVDLLVTNPGDVRIEGFESAGASVGTQSFAASALQAGAVRLSGKAITRVTLESSGTESALLHQICWECPKAPTTGRSIDVDFRESPGSDRPNPVVEQGVSFTVSDNIGGAPIPRQFVEFDRRLTIGTGMVGPIVDIQLPCPTKRVTLQMSTPPAPSGPAVRQVIVQAFNQNGTLAQRLELSTGLDAVVLEGEAITRIQIDNQGTDLLLHRIFFDCNAAGTATGPSSISMVGIAEGGFEVTGMTITGDPGQVVAGTLEPQGSAGLSAITISEGNAALIDVCYVPVQQSETFGWQELPKFSYPLCLPVADAGYPCPGRPATSADAKTLALSRVTYPAPVGWDQDFPGLHDELVALVHGGPGTPMANVEHPTLAGTPLSPSTQSDIPTFPGLKPLDLIFLASLHPAIAQMLGLYFVDQSAVADVNYDYLLLGDPTGVLGGSAASALEWLAFAADREPVWMQALLNQSTGLRPSIAPPDKPNAYALPGMATRAIDGSLPVQAAGSVGLWWPLPSDPADEQPQPDRIVFYYPRRVFLGTTRPADEPDPLQYTTRLSAVLVSEPDPPDPSAPPIARSSEWPPPSVALYVIDSNLAEGWYSYRLAGQDLFGRHSSLSAPAAWFQWDPVPPTPPPWYYQPSGNKSIDSFAVALLDKMPPPAPLGVEAWALDPDDQWVLADAAYNAWRTNNTIVGLRVRWRWTLMQQIQAPDTHEFRLYYQPGRWNALLGNVETVTAAVSPDQSEVDIDFADAHAVDAFAGTRLRVGNDDFKVIGSQPGTKLHLRVQNIGANDLVPPTQGKPCTIAIPETHALWVDTSKAATWAKRLTLVPYDPPARTVVDPSKDAAGLLLTSEVFNTAPAIVTGVTLTLPSPANLSGIQPWIDHFWLRDGNGVEQTHRIVQYDFGTRTVTLETVPTVTPASWMVGRPAREYDVFLPAPDVGINEPFAPTLAEPSVYAQIAVSAADEKTHVADTFPGGTLVGNESSLSPSATVYRVRQRLDEVPELPQLDDRLVATPADYHSRSYTTFRFVPVPHLKIHILRALDDTLFQRDWLVRETRKSLDPAKHPDAFPETWNTARQQSAATALNLIHSDAAYASLPSDAWDVLARLPGNERAAGKKPILQNPDLQARDWLVRRTHSAIDLTDTNLFPTYWTPATRQAAFGAVNSLAAPADYPALLDNPLRLLAALPGNEPAFALITIHPFEMSDPEIQDQRRPDDKATYPPDPTLRAYMDTLSGRATNRYFYRASFVDGAQNQGALSLPGPPVYLPKVEPPRAPVITKVIGGDRQITIQWAANREPDLTQYQVYRTDRQEAALDTRTMTLVSMQNVVGPPESLPTELEWIDSTVPGLTTFYYRLCAVDASGNLSAPSVVVLGRAFDDSRPDPPHWNPAVAGTTPDEIALTWSSPIPDLRCLVQRRIAGATVWENVSNWLARGTYAYTDTDRIPGLQYDYRLRVMDSGGKTNNAYEALTF